VQWEKR